MAGIEPIPHNGLSGAAEPKHPTCYEIKRAGECIGLVVRQDGFVVCPIFARDRTFEQLRADGWTITKLMTRKQFERRAERLYHAHFDLVQTFGYLAPYTAERFEKFKKLRGKNIDRKIAKAYER
jgi:hypothetical protein